MIGALVGIFMILISIPMSTVALAGKFRAKKLDNKKSLMGKIFKKNPLAKIKAKIPVLNKVEKKKKAKEEPTTKKGKLKNKVKATLLRVTSHILHLTAFWLRTIGTAMLGVGFVSLMMCIVLCAVLAGGISSALYVVQEGQQSDTGTANVITNTAQAATPTTSSSDAQSKIYEIIDWYLDNIHGYAADNNKMQPCDKPWAGSSQKVRPDCSGFATCVARYLSGNMGIPLFSSHSCADTLKASGFTEVKASSKNDIKLGDIMVMSSHVEIAMGDGKNFGWGTNRSNSQTFGTDKPDGKYDNYKAREWRSDLKDSNGKVYYGKKEIKSIWRWAQ